MVRIHTRYRGDTLLTAESRFLENLNQYLQLKHITMPTLNSDALRTEFWNENISEPIDDTALSMALFLIDPLFHKTRSGEDFEPRSKPARNFTGTHFGACQIGNLIINAQCLGAPLVGDHKWPYSLGGDTSPGNLLKLCATCNRQKSSSIIFYPWSDDTLPPWIVSMLVELKSAKS